jgi:Domain of unknown function DUF11/Secretion system C-terminal sorting domain/PAP2 superfamily/HYR domain
MSKTYTSHFWVILFLFFGSSPLDGQNTPASAFDSKIVREWNTLFLDLERFAPGFRPCPAGTAAGYLGLSLYEAIVPGIPDFQSQSVHLSGLNLPAPPAANLAIHWPSAANESYAYIMTRFFGYLSTSQPANFAKIENLRLNWKSKLATTAAAAAITAGENRGKTVAQAVWNWLETDLVVKNGWLNAQPANYLPPIGQGLWQPTAPDFSKAVFPFYGNARCFALPENEKTCNPPPIYGEINGNKWRVDAEEVFNNVNTIRSNGAGAAELKALGEFWSDDLLNLTFSPPMRLIAIANQIGREQQLNLAEAAEFYAKLGLSMHDVAVATWKSKYIYNIERPISYIRRVLPNATNWLSALDNPLTGAVGITPAFPAYPSGHSGFGGVTDGVFTAFFGENFQFIDSSHLGRTEFYSTPTPYPSFKSAGEANAYSRIPLGVHFRFDCDEGLRLGRLAAQRVIEMPWRKPDCNLVQFSGNGGKIDMRGLCSPFVLIQIFDQNWQKVFDFTGATGVSSVRTTGNLATGNYFVKINLMNSSWQQICEKSGFVTVSPTAPTGILTFAQPADVSQTAALGANSATIAFPTPTANSTCPNGNVSVTQISGNPSNSNFPIGQSQVCFIATDGCGNSKSRCFSVNVLPANAIGDCNSVAISSTIGQITVSGLNAPLVLVQVFNSSWQMVYNYAGASTTSRTIPNLTADNYFVKIELLNTFWQPICKKEAQITVGGTIANPADLQITMTSDKITAGAWTQVNYTVVAKNAGSTPITSAVISIKGCQNGQNLSFLQSFGMVYASTPTAPTAGNFNFIDQNWTLQNLAAGQTAVLKIPLFTLSNSEKKVVAFAVAQSPADPNSQPSPTLSNCIAVQNDEAVVTLNAGQSVEDSDDRADAQNLISSNRAKNQNLLFPNPAGDFVEINLAQFLGKENVEMQIFDNKGLIIKQLRFDKIDFAIEKISLETFQNGLYFVRFVAPNLRPETVKLVVQRTF